MIPDVLLLCGGKSSRMSPLSDKILFHYLGKTVLEHQVQMLLQSGFTHTIHFVTNQQNNHTIQTLLKQTFPDHFSKWTFSLQTQFDHGMLDALMSAREKIDMEKSLLIMSSNDFVEKKFFVNLLHHYNTSDSNIFICGKKVQNYFPGGYLVLEQEKYVKKIQEKPGAGNEPSEVINLVFHLFRSPKKIFHFAQKEYQITSTQDGYEQCLQNVFDDGNICEVIPYTGFWQALKYPWHHLELMNFFLSTIDSQQIDTSVQISPHVSIRGNVMIESGVKIFDFASLCGPLYIGKNTIIGNHSLLRESLIGHNCVIGHTTEIARSYLKSDIWMHQNYIGDSVLDENVSFGAGSRTGNFRLDEGDISVNIKGESVNSHRNKLGILCGKNVRVGINTSFMPGKKIGANSSIGACLSISQDIPDASFVKKKEPIEIRPNKFFATKRI